VTIVAASW